MLLGNLLSFDENTVFYTLRNNSLMFSEVFNTITDYIKADINSSYRISIGTDSQVGSSSTIFVTCIHVHRIGKGAIGFLHKSEVQRAIKNLREKIYLETCATLQLAYVFDDNRIKSIYDILDNKHVFFEFHIDIGKKGQTRNLINEMTGMVNGLNFVPKIKPDSFCASSFADKYTRVM